MLTYDSAIRAARTFLVAFLTLFIPGVLGWLNAVTEWARGEGSTPFPDARGLAYLGVSAIVAGLIALVNLALNWIEDALGKGIGRTPTTASGRHARSEGGYSRMTGLRWLLAAVAVIVLIWFIFGVLAR